MLYSVNTRRYLPGDNARYRVGPMEESPLYHAGTLATRLRAAMGHAGITQQELSRRSGVKQPVISRILAGRQERCSDVVKLAIACGVRPEWLAEGQGPMVDPVPPAVREAMAEDYKMRAMADLFATLPEEAKDLVLKAVAATQELVKKAGGS
jgi:transcriptional regulator with XRE-family HTH domain